MKTRVLSTFPRIHTLCTLALAGILGLIGAGFWSLFHHPVGDIATVDVTRLIHTFVNTQSHANLSLKQQEAAVQAFGHSLDEALQSLAKDQKKIILPKEAVICGAPDLTESVERRIQTQLQNREEFLNVKI